MIESLDFTPPKHRFRFRPPTARQALARQNFSRGDPGPSRVERRAAWLSKVPLGWGGVEPEFDDAAGLVAAFAAEIESTGSLAVGLDYEQPFKSPDIHGCGRRTGPDNRQTRLQRQWEAKRAERQRLRERIDDQEWEEARRREAVGDRLAVPEMLLALGRAAEALADMESSGLLFSLSSWLDENGAVDRWRLD